MTESVPVNEQITLAELVSDPYPLYKRMRAKTPVLAVKSVGRTLLTKATETKYVKDNPELFSSDDPNTPMEKAFQAKTLMRRDGEDHMRLRRAMVPAFTAPNIRDIWIPEFTRIAEEYIGRLPKGETIDFFPGFAGPIAGRCLANLLGMPDASDDEMQRWSQVLIDGAGNFGWSPELFERTDQANQEVNDCLAKNTQRLRAEPDQTALSVQINADDPIEMEHVVSNIKIAIGGGLNEPRDSMMTILFGLLTNRDQLEECKSNGLWSKAFEEGVRWVAPIQASSRRVTEDTEIRGYHVPKGDVVMTIQASANHDEDVFEDGHLYNIFRDKNPHQAFGNGPHYCMGTNIARRLVGDIVLPMLFDRFPNMTLENPPDVVWRGFGFRGPLNLPISLN